MTVNCAIWRGRECTLRYKVESLDAALDLSKVQSNLKKKKKEKEEVSSNKREMRTKKAEQHKINYLPLRRTRLVGLAIVDFDYKCLSF